MRRKELILRECTTDMEIIIKYLGKVFSQQVLTKQNFSNKVMDKRQSVSFIAETCRI